MMGLKKEQKLVHIIYKLKKQIKNILKIIDKIYKKKFCLEYLKLLLGNYMFRL